MKSALRWAIAVLSLICVLSSIGSISLSVSADDLLEETALDKSYFEFYNQNSSEDKPTDIYDLDYSAAVNELKISTIEGKECAVLEKKGDYIEWQFEVKTSGNYAIYPTYCALEGSIKNIEVSVLIDGKSPFAEAKNLSLTRYFRDETENGEFLRDISGNDLTPKQVEIKRWSQIAFKDSLGMYSEPYFVNLTKGVHTVKIKYESDPVAIKMLTFKNEKEPVSYRKYLSQYNKSNLVKGDVCRIEAEKALYKTSSTLEPTYDRSNAATQPSNPFYIRLNTIGGSSWVTCGDSVSYEVDVPKEGLYKLSFRARQNYSEGMNSYRRIYINGEVPFKEAEKVKFEYNSKWYVKTVGEEEPMLFYLKKGDIITIECTSGDMDYPLREVQQAVLDLNKVYRDIIMITGTSPSMYQDYDLETQLPNLVQNLENICKRLDVAAQAIDAEMGTSSTGGATIVKAVKMFRELADDAFYIPDRLSNFKGSIESLASLLLTLGGQALELDCIYIVPINTSAPKASAGIFESLSYGFKRFFATFLSEYNSVGGSKENDGKSILVWAELGRDQAQILNRLVEEDYTENTGVPVQLNLVSGASTLIKATLAGKGPDIALVVDAVTPVNLAARGALVDLSQFDLSSLEKEIYESAWTPFKYQNGIYGVPTTQGCDVLFYRTDIFESLGLSVPDTWDDFYRVLEVLQSKNLQVAWPEIMSGDQGNSAAINIFNKFLFQNGGDYYNEDLSKTLFDTEVAYSAFEKTVELYRTYGISREINTFNRFRSGEVPLAISSYSLYTQLVSSAPEIRGLWNFALIPGTEKSDGSIDRTECAASSGSVMLKRAVERGVEKEAFDFLLWWAGSETQAAYGKSLEGVMGVIGRITPANRVALSNLGWSEAEFEIIDTQMKASYNQPQVIGNYQISRSLTAAIRAAITDENTPRRALSIYNKDINDEITRKRKEFHLD